MPISLPDSPHPPHGFAQLLGLHPLMAVLLFLVDTMLYGEEGLAALLTPLTAGGSLLASVVISCCAGVVLGFISYKAQQKWYGDDKDAALVKALVIGFLTALPFPLPLPAMLSVPAGLLGVLGGRKND